MNLNELFKRLLQDLPDGEVTGVNVGNYRAAVTVKVDGEIRCGLASNVSEKPDPDDLLARNMVGLPGRELAKFVLSDQKLDVSIGLATINALLPHLPHKWVDLNSREFIAQLGRNKTVVIVGHFPFVPELRPRVGKLIVLEQKPKEDDLPASAASDVIPQADVLAITAMTLVNGTFDHLMSLRRPGMPTLLLGPTTPLSPILFEMGVTVLSGSVVEQPLPVVNGVIEDAGFRKLRKMGIRLVSMVKDDLPIQ